MLCSFHCRRQDPISQVQDNTNGPHEDNQSVQVVPDHQSTMAHRSQVNAIVSLGQVCSKSFFFTTMVYHTTDLSKMHE